MERKNLLKLVICHLASQAFAAASIVATGIMNTFLPPLLIGLLPVSKRFSLSTTILFGFVSTLLISVMQSGFRVLNLLTAMTGGLVAIFLYFSFKTIKRPNWKHYALLAFAGSWLCVIIAWLRGLVDPFDLKKEILWTLTATVFLPISSLILEKYVIDNKQLEPERPKTETH
ncbi:MAG: hypothetical protein NT067_05075 [Candidatus Diapherotrites archaeon]|nr:hypothetical protein [Candidatus Diapherotrites archaeon]